MTYLPSLIKKIDSFYNQIISTAQSTDPDYAEELKALSGGVDDPGLKKQLRMLADLYRYALSMGGGYSTIARVINNLKEMYSDGGYSDIETTVNGMLKVLAKEAGGVQALAGRDNPSFVNRLMELKSDIESRPEEDDEVYNNYQDEINTPGSDGESEGDYSEYGLGGDSEAINPAALGFGSKDDPKVNRGWHTVGPSKLYKNWKEYYENEVNAYTIQLAQTNDPGERAAIEELINLLPQISELVSKKTEFADHLKVVPNDEATVKKLTLVQTTLKNLKEKINKLKSSVRLLQLRKDQVDLQSQVEEAIRKNDPKAKELAEQKLALNQLTQSSDVYKAKERNLRLRLIESMSGGNFPGKDTLEKEKSKINLAKTERVSQEAYDRKRTEERGMQQGRVKTPTYENSRGGRRVPMESLSPDEKVDFDKSTFAALIKKLRDDNNTAISDARKYIMRPNEKGDPAFKPFVDEVSATIRKGDKAAQYAAIEKLKMAIKEKLSVRESSLKGYVQSIRLSPHFKNIEERLYELVKSKKVDAAGNLINITEEDKQKLTLLVNDIGRVRSLYSRYYQNAGFKSKDQPYAFFKNVLTALNRIELHLALQLHVQRPEKKMLGPKTEYQQMLDVDQQKEKLLQSSNSSVRRMMFIIAQEAPADQVDPMTADKLAKDIFDKLFNEEYQKMVTQSMA